MKITTTAALLLGTTLCISVAGADLREAPNEHTSFPSLIRLEQKIPTYRRGHALQTWVTGIKQAWDNQHPIVRQVMTSTNGELIVAKTYNEAEKLDRDMFTLMTVQNQLREQQLHEQRIHQLQEQRLREQQRLVQNLRLQQLREQQRREQQLREQEIEQERLRVQQLRQHQEEQERLRVQQRREQQLREQEIEQERLRVQQLRQHQEEQERLRVQQRREQQLREQEIELRRQQEEQEQIRIQIQTQQKIFVNTKDACASNKKSFANKRKSKSRFPLIFDNIKKKFAATSHLTLI
ncbi:hypothetical protein [Candidatus Odyssella acanthamoebae]|uniref:Uncharacterized protein n=1 Tax=Candidatus Odyssella acanthamoebae TaxID=91604 RepID=A0A077AUX0_9PROT|nr:hypothetical protein [Candidatus Paracaedibacter acanthamoebae]AIK95834.1 hypothetical protein ID47_02420 [Candidatus Paracaedibacter acanthamoebae]